MMLLRVVIVFAVGVALAVMVHGSTLAATGNELTAEKEVGELGEAGDVIVKEALEPGHEAGHAKEVDPNPLEFRTDLAIWTGIVFLVLMFVLWWFAWGPIANALDQREQAVANQIAEAEKSNEDAKAILAQYEQKLSDAKNEVRAFLDQARRDAGETGRQIVEAARGEAREEHQRALAEIDGATAGALKELAERSADLAVGLAGKIVRAELKASDHVGLVERAVADFVAKKPSDSQAP